MKKIQIISIVGILIAVVLFAGCSTTPYQSPPSISITKPTNGASLPAGSVTVTVSVQNFNLVNKIGQSNNAGEGHIIYYKDVTAPATQNQPATTASGTYYATANTSYTWLNVTAGSHTFSAQLVNNDQSPLNPTVSAAVTVTIQGATAPQITITQPTSGQTLPAGNITVKVQVSNFQLVDKLGQTSVQGQGHIHYFMDYPPPTTPNEPAIPPSGMNVSWAATANTSYTFKNVSAGSHTVYVELVNNNHTPLVPPVTSSVAFTVTSSGGGGGNNTAVIYLMAKDISFNLSTITVPAGAHVIVHFTNEDQGIPHNFAVYDTPAASTVIFRGQIITGVSSITYNFTAPSTPGNYFFRCDVHPTIMTGTFIVT